MNSVQSCFVIFQPFNLCENDEHCVCFLTLVVQERWGHKEVRHGAVMVGFDLGHGGPEQWDIVFDWRLDHGLVDLVVDFWDLAGKEMIGLLKGH